MRDRISNPRYLSENEIEDPPAFGVGKSEQHAARVAHLRLTRCRRVGQALLVDARDARSAPAKADSCFVGVATGLQARCCADLGGDQAHEAGALGRARAPRCATAGADTAARSARSCASRGHDLDHAGRVFDQARSQGRALWHAREGIAHVGLGQIGDLQAVGELLDADQLGQVDRDRDVARLCVQQFRFKRERLAVSLLE